MVLRAGSAPHARSGCITPFYSGWPFAECSGHDGGGLTYDAIRHQNIDESLCLRPLYALLDSLRKSEVPHSHSNEMCCKMWIAYRYRTLIRLRRTGAL